MQVRTRQDDSRSASWTGALSLVGAMPDDEPLRSGVRWRAAVVGGELRLAHDGDAVRSIPLADLRGAAPVDLPGGHDAVALQVGHGERVSVLLATPVVSLLARRGGRAGALLDALAEVGVPIITTPVPPMLSDPAGTVWTPLEDTILWSGRASIPPHPWIPPQAAHVWLTTRAIRWSIDGSGACRLPIPDLIEARSVSRGRGPVEASFIYRNHGLDYALAIRFDLHGTDRAERERGAFMTALRSRGVRCTAEVRPDPVAPVRGTSRPHPLRSTPDGAVTRAPVVHGRLATPAAGITEARAVEASLLGEIHRLNRALSGQGPAPHDGEFGAPVGAGLAALDAAERTGAAPPAEVAARRSRMLTLAEAATRLRTLVDLRERGHLAGQDLDSRRRALLESLGPHLLA
jgi:hypothetical protein